ncbi:MAG: tyrosine-type recombinase/integrase [Pseudonocardiaceae bacterium]
METTYAVSIWKITEYEGKRRKTHNVRWKVGKQEFRVPFKTYALADSFRSELVTAAKKGEPFDTATGRPGSARRADTNTDWFTFAGEYVAIKWPDASPEHRRGIAEALTNITAAMLASGRNKPDDRVLRRACKAAFNLNLRESAPDDETTVALRWLERNTSPVSDLASPDILRAVIKAISSTLDGRPAASSTTRRKRMTLRNALDFAVERRLLTVNPLNEVKPSTKTKASGLRQIDRRSVVNPVQARSLLVAVADLPPSGPRLVAFFGSMYYAALRPEEAAALSKHHLSLPDEGWGELHLERARPEVAPEWTDSNSRGEERGLKHRDPSEGRTVPCPPELTSLLHAHVETYGAAPDGRLFRGVRNDGRIGSTVYGRTWANARAATFTPEVLASPLAKRPYDLRHAAVSTWLKAGVEATRVAEWAGHSVAVLMHAYAKFIDGGERSARARVEDALRG